MDYQTPGVFVEETPVLASSVAGVSTAIPAFIGYTTQAGAVVKDSLYYKPTRITTFNEYESIFGKAEEAISVKVKGDSVTDVALPATINHMYYGMQLFFNNGGESCYIVAMNEKDTQTAAERFAAAVDALELEDEPTLIVLVDGVNMAPVVNPETGESVNPYYSICQRVLNQCNKMKDRFAIIDVIDNGTPGADANAFRNGLASDYLRYGAAYYPYLNTTLNYQYSDASVTINDGTTPKKLQDIDLKTALYNNITQAIKSYLVTIPPSSAVAGVYASVDRNRGVWKAPANVSLALVTGPKVKLTEEQNGVLNVDAASGKSINAIRNFTGKGTLIWGARTLAGNDNEWRYVPIRRLFNYVEESIQKATAFAVFEPNTSMTWLKLRSMVESFLDNLWRQGALAGGKAEDAYFVQVGLGTTMTSQDIMDGRLIIKVGLAAVRPAEFIILQFTHKLQTA
jgi:phage tail sheath protein FI